MNSITPLQQTKLALTPAKPTHPMTSDECTALLFGPYHTPPFRHGQVVLCEVRGYVKIVGLKDALIPWPNEF
jgi:hypothetical protein